MEQNADDNIKNPSNDDSELPTSSNINSISPSEMLDYTLQIFVTLSNSQKAQIHDLKRKTYTLLDEMLQLKEEIEEALEDEIPLEEMEET